MRSTWNLKNKLLVTHDWEEREVILEFNGPQLVLLECDDDLYLSVASDGDETRTRWLRARISPVEYQALLLGGTTVRDCILKPKIIVVDTNHQDATIAEFPATPDDLCESDMPNTNSVLPAEMTGLHKKKLASPNPRFSLDGPGITNHAVSFRVLGEILQYTQRLWNAIGQAILGETTVKGRVPDEILAHASLAFAGTFPGSFGLQLQVDDEKIFGQIASQYKELILAASDNERLSQQLHSLKTRVRSTFSDYLSVLHRHQTEMLALWDEEAAFISASTADRVHANLEFAVGDKEEEIHLEGYFLGLNLKDTSFVFYDPADESHYIGRVSPRVLRSSLPITIGVSKTYKVKLSIASLHAVEGASKQVVSLEDVALVADTLAEKASAAT